MRICIYAFSSTAFFFRGLIDACKAAGDDVEWSVVFPQGHFRYVMAGAVPPERQCYLYENFSAVYKATGEAQIQRALESGEGAISALMKDKDGYRHLGKGEQLKRAGAMHACYEEFLRRVKPDFVLFPDLEVVDGFVLMNLCKSLGIGAMYFTSLRILGRSFFASDSYETLPSYFGGHVEHDIRDARAAIRSFRERKSLSSGASYPAAPPPKPSLFRRTFVSAWLRWRYERLHVTEDIFTNRIRRNVRKLADRLLHLRFELTAARFFDRVDFDRLPAKYVLYALHYTPESSVNGLEPYYVDQLRAVDALLLSLPKGHRLVVKEHPAMRGHRKLTFYRELRRRPGLILLHPSVDSRRLVEKAVLVATITGTIGLESYLLGKPCLSFGRNFFAHLCRQAPALHELKACMAELIASYVPPSEAEKEIAIAKLLNIAADFDIANPWQFPASLAPENIGAARDHLWRHIERLGDPARRQGHNLSPRYAVPAN